MIELSDLKKVHIVGIGGIGISAVAHMLLAGNPRIGLSPCVVSGSDAATSLVSQRLQEKGATIFAGHEASHVPEDADCVIHTAAVGDENPEIIRAKKLDIPLLTYSQMIGIISKDFYTIAVSGTHGKTTTTAMLGKVLVDGGLDPTIIVGSLLKESGSNLVLGNSNYLVIEADEYKKSFHSLNPSVLVVTNIDEDHLDFYKDLSDIQSSFSELAQRIPKDGLLVCNSKDPHLASVIEGVQSDVADYSEEELSVQLKVPGSHNRENAKAALAVARFLNISEEKALASLAEFSGTWRRFEYRGTMPTGALVYDDYAHNPQKVRAALAGAREAFPDKKITVVFGPHLYSRTKLLLKEFGISFAPVDRVIVTDIYAAREVFDPTIHSRDLVTEIQKHHTDVSYIPDFEAITADLMAHTDSESVVILVGAGDIYNLGGDLTKQ